MSTSDPVTVAMQEAAVKGNQSIVYFTHYVYWFCTIAPALCMCVHAGVSGSGRSQECLPPSSAAVTHNKEQPIQIVFVTILPSTQGTKVVHRDI